ncbi:MAG: S41 family peptidase [Pseudomonadota bacterium]
MKCIRIVISALFVLSLLGCQSIPMFQQAQFEERVLTPNQIRSDIHYLEDALRKIHPEPFNRLSYSDYLRSKAIIDQNIFWPMTERNVYVAISKLLQSFRDQHLKLQISSDLIKSYREVNGGFFPLAIIYQYDDVWVAQDLSDQPLIPTGAQILKINGQPIEWVMHELESLISYETLTSRYRLVQTQFALLYWLRFQHDFKNYTIEYVWNNKIYSSSIKPIKNQFENPDNVSSSFYGTHHINKETDLLWINDFNENTEKFSEFLEGFFSEFHHQKRKNLIVDVRYNAGGVSENAWNLLRYLDQESADWVYQYQVKVSKNFESFHSENLNAVKKEKLGNSLAWLPLEYLQWTQWEFLITGYGKTVEQYPRKRESLAKGPINLILLINGHCLSACAVIASKIKEKNLGVIIGEETGSFVDEQYVYPLQVHLPNSGIVVNIPTTKAIFSHHRRNDKSFHQGTKPDIFIKRTQEDIILKSDASFVRAMRYLKNFHVKHPAILH